MSTKRKLISAVAAILISVALLVTTAILAEEAIITPLPAVALTLISVAAVLAAISYAAKVDYETGNYQCRKCGSIFKPSFREYFFGAHTLTTRHLKCPKCNRISWCKRISIKEKSND